MLVKLHAQHETTGGSSKEQHHPQHHLFSYPPSTSPAIFELGPLGAALRLPCMPGAKLHCPVDGCAERSDRWGKRSHPLPTADSFTLQLNAQFDVSSNNRICQPCWKRHSDHTISLDGRTRVVPPTSSSALDTLLSAVISPLAPSPIPLPSPPSVASLASAPPTLARVVTPFPAYPSLSSTHIVLPSYSSSTRPVLPQVITSPRRTHSSPPVLDMSPAPSTYAERQRDVVASVMAGIDYERYRLQQVMQGVTPMAKSTWYDHQSTVYNSIIQIAESKEVEYLQMLKATGQRLVFCADAAWSHRGFEANQCCWLLLNAENKQIALAVILTKSRWEKGQEVHKGNYKGSSGGMEGMAMERGIARLKENGLLQLVEGWVCDKDSSVSEQLKANPDTAHIPIHYDPGHIKKNFQKSLMAIYGAGVRYKGLAERGG